MKEPDNKEIELKSEEFREILGAIPPWILRWGIVVIAAIILSGLAGSAVFKYPDVISSTMVLTGACPVASVAAHSSGKLREIYIKDDESVRRGQHLGVIDNPASTEDVFILKAYLQNVCRNIEADNSLPPKELNLGDIRGLYASFYLTLADFYQFKKSDYYPQKILFIEDRLNYSEEYYQKILLRKGLMESRVKSTKEQYAKDSLLTTKGLLSDKDLKKSQNEYLQNLLSLEEVYSTLDELKINLVQLKEALLDAENEYENRENTLVAQLNAYITQLQSAIKEWELNYVLSSPIDGQVTFTKFWAENQIVTNQEIVFSIVPSDTNRGEVIGRAFLPVARSGKVERGQKVNVRFENFPENEYGVVKGVVDNISRVPLGYTDSRTGEITGSYVVSIKFPDGLRTTYNKNLPSLPQMQAQADIMTDDVSLLERFFMPLKKIWMKGMK